MSSLIGVIASGSKWKDPALSFAMLPLENNILGDIRLVLDEGKLYYWDADTSQWKVVN